MKIKRIGIYLIVVCLISFQLKAADPMKGNGTILTKQLTPGDFNEIRIKGEMTFHYEQSDDTPRLEVSIDENLYPHLHIEVKDRVLTIEFKKVKVESLTEFRVKGNSPWLKASRVADNAGLILMTPLTGDELEIRGNANSLIHFMEPVRVGKLDLIVKQSANIVAEKIETEQLKCDMDGSGSITLRSGDATKASYLITGSSDLHAYGLEVPDVICKITGSGKAEIYAAENLKANVIGSGTILYKGSPSVKNTIIGKGSITKAN